MSLEKGGRADKYGNEYENQFLARLFVRLVKGEYKSVIVEPLGDNRDSVEYIAIDQKDFLWHYQCKSSNTTHKYWTMYDLSSHDVFKRSKQIVQESPNNIYVFVSPLNYGELAELCKRARTNLSVEEFIKHQINSSEIQKTFNDCSKYYGLRRDDSDECKELVHILSKSYFEMQPSGIENVSDSNEHIGMFFMGDSDSARGLLESYVNSRGLYGVAITANDIIDYMEQSGYYTRANIYNDKLIIKLNELNSIYYDVYQPINGELIYRKETEKVINSIIGGESIVLHGKAGSGKSGCIQNVIEELKRENILYLALKLDKAIPSISADSYGDTLGLSQSPVYCLHNLSAGKNCVLILDQLDSLRWTAQHSSSALSICKSLISQARTLNKYDNGHISIIFVTRTFDLENDAGLKALFSSKDKETPTWKKIQVSALSAEEVESVIGPVYRTLSVKLRKLLLIPSSLYIWTQLTDQNNAKSITTPHHLMEKWWQEILNNCKSVGLDPNRISTIKNKIVKNMEASAVLAIALTTFPDYGTEIDALVSNGLLTKSNNQVAFTHQSFLDYFAVSEMLNAVYGGKSILEIIGGLSEQTPVVRYRVLRILQSLIESNEDFFIKISEDILSSDNVRHYFKCCVFEVIGQSENPGNRLLDYAYNYLIDPSWHDYVYQTVYYGHVNFVLDLDNRSSFEWLDEKGLDLLYSINTIAQEFVLNKLEPLCDKDKESDLKVYRTLCHDCSDDGPSMLNLRLKLFERNANILESFWGVSHLIESDSDNLIPILRLMVQMHEQIKRHIYFGDREDKELYARTHYKELIDELLPVVCEKTAKFEPQWPNYDYSDEYRNWTEEDYREHSSREIVDMLKISMSEFSKTKPDEFIDFVSSFSHYNSVVYYEICSAAIYNLDTQYGDFAISWLCLDPTNHFLIYTGSQKDYLSATKQIIDKFSHYCSDEVFEKLEKIVFAWKEPCERMTRIYKRRIEVNKEKQWGPVYYAYWGHMQKELLPLMDAQRISTQSKELINVLNRNACIEIPYYKGFGISGGAKSVVSPIYNKADTISDKKWLEIISTPAEKMKGHFSHGETEKYYIEADHFSFSSSMLSQAKHNPCRFAKLALQFPLECYSGYIDNVIHAIYDHDEGVDEVDFSVVCNIINRYKHRSELSVHMAMLRLIAMRSEEVWPDEIVDYLCEVAVGSKEMDMHTGIVIDKDKIATPHTLITAAINSAQGSAFENIGKLLWEFPDLIDKFKPIIEKACDDKKEYVRFSVVFSLFPCFGIDKDFTLSTFRHLIETDIRIIAFPDSWELVCRDYIDNSDFYADKLIEACNSGIEELDDCSAGLLCASAIYLDNNLLSKLYELKLTNKQVDKVCHQAAFSFNQEEYHEASKEVLEHYLDIDDNEINAFGRLFYDRCINIDRDEDFLLKLMSSKQSLHQLHAFLEFVEKQDRDISKYVNVLKIITEHISIDKDTWDRHMLLDDLIKCIVKLFDKNKYNVSIKNHCLDMWDNLYRESLTAMRSFTDIFDNMN